MKPYFVLTFLLICSVSLSACSFSKKNRLKSIIHKHKNKLRQLQTSDTSSDSLNETIVYDPTKSSSGLSAGGICAIAIPCIAALVGVGAAAAILGGSAPAASLPALANPVTTVPPPTYVDTTMAQLAVPQEIPVQPEIIQPKVEIPPQPVQQIIKPSYPINNVESPVINVPQQVVAQPQLVPVQQMQLVPVQQVEMVPVQQVEMVPVQEVVPTYQTAQVAPKITQISEIPKVTQVQGAQVIQGGQGIQGGEFITAPEGYGTSAIQGSTNPLNIGEFSSNNLV